MRKGLALVPVLSGIGFSSFVSAGLVPAGQANYETFRVGQIRREVLTFGCPLASRDAAVEIAKQFSGYTDALDAVFSVQSEYDAFLKETRCGAVSSEESEVVEILFKADQSKRDDETVTDRNGISRSPTRGLSLILMKDVASGRRYLALVDAGVEGEASRPRLVTGKAPPAGEVLAEGGAGRDGGGKILGLSPGELCAGLTRLVGESRSGFAGIKGELKRQKRSSDRYAPTFALLPKGRCDLVHYPRNDRWSYTCGYRIESQREADGLRVQRDLVESVKRCLGSGWTESSDPGGPFSLAATELVQGTTTVGARVFSVRSSLVTVHLSVEGKGADF